MYIIIKRDKAERLKERMHYIKEAAVEVLDCVEEALEAYNRHSEHHYREESRYPSDHHYPEHKPYPEHEYYREMARRGRMRY